MPLNHTTSRIPFAQRFWSHVEILGPNDCWIWQAAIVKGYGKFKADNRKMLASHRIAYELTHGPIAANLVICHRCDNPLCCNPAHLFAGTHADNASDRNRKNRQARQKGEAHGGAKLTEKQIVEIRHLYSTGNYTQRDLGNLFGVAHTAISRIVRGKRWSHVQLQTSHGAPCA